MDPWESIERKLKLAADILDTPPLLQTWHKNRIISPTIPTISGV